MSRDQYQDEVILPSKGLLYDSNLIPDGRMVITMMGTQEEKILAGSRVTAGKLITQLLDRLIVEPKGVSSKDLLMVDRLYLLLKVRVLTFGSEYGFKMACPSCNVTSRFEVDLADIEIKSIPEGFEEPFEVKLPLCGETVWLRLLRGNDDEAVQAQVRKNQEKGASGLGDPAYLPTMARTIHHTDSIPEMDVVRKQMFVQNLKSRDSLAMSQAFEDVEFGPDMNLSLICPACGSDIETSVPFGEEFFRPKLSRKS